MIASQPLVALGMFRIRPGRAGAEAIVKQLKKGDAFAKAFAEAKAEVSGIHDGRFQAKPACEQCFTRRL